ncbi:37S ribosomal protein S23 mitochondrial [Ascosphaera acerosa]|nr:37S ribosomal protein S23 mitochondrial [Ascosphaera acerosa]
MSSHLCKGCLAQLPLQLPRRPAAAAAAAAATSISLTRSPAQPPAFSTTHLRAAMPMQKKSNASRDQGPKFRERRSVLIPRKAIAKKQPMAPGELRAARERIVLGNANALAVPSLTDMTAQSLSLGQTADTLLVAGKMASFPMELLEPLKNARAFRPTQKWGLFLRPATMVRPETLRLARAMEEAEQARAAAVKVVTGRKGTGKSVLLAQAAAMALLRKWVVVPFPEAQDLVNGHTAYAPVRGLPDGRTKYVQKNAAAALLHRIAFSSADTLAALHVSQHHPALRALPLEPTTDLRTLACMGIDDPNVAWPVFQALWAELTATQPAEGLTGLRPFKQRPPVLLSVDNVAHWMKESKYRDADFKPVHAHDLLLVDFFLSAMSSPSALPNGGLVLAATSTSNAPSVESFSVLLDQLRARDAGIAPSAPSFPRINPYSTHEDARVLDLFGACTNSQVYEMLGLTKQETKTLMEYYAFSGLLRDKVDQASVAEKWTLSGGGVIGELERLALRLRTAPQPLPSS